MPPILKFFASCDEIQQSVSIDALISGQLGGNISPALDEVLMKVYTFNVERYSFHLKDLILFSSVRRHESDTIEKAFASA